MNRIFMLGRANIRGAKGQTAVLAALFLISAIMLNIGLTVMLGFGSFFDKTAEELNTSDAFFVIPQDQYTHETESYFATHEKISAYQTNRGIATTAKYDWKGEAYSKFSIICDKDEPRSLSQWKLVGDFLPETPKSIYVPYLHKVTGGYNLGDRLILEIDGAEYDFIVSGYIESIYSDTIYVGDILFVPGNRFDELYSVLETYRKVLVNTKGTGNCQRMASDLQEVTNLSTFGYAGDIADPGSTLLCVDYESIKMGRTMMSALMSALIIVFTAVMAAVSLFVIRFRIKDSIEEDMSKIGSLQSIGYTSRQIMFATVVQYSMIALIACLAGIIPAYLLLPAVGNIFTQQGGFLWQPGFAPAINLFVLSALMLIVMTVSFIAALKIRRINPVQALRGGILIHNFKRNYVPLEKTRLPLTAALSCKSILQGIRQKTAMFIVITAVALTATIAVVLYYNAAVDITAFEKVPGIEKTNAAIAFMPGQDAAALRDEAAAHKDVRKVQYVDRAKIRVDDLDVDCVVMDDFSGKETANVYQGSFPKHNNEVAISGRLAQTTHKGIGDEIIVGKEGQRYLISGLTQGMEVGSPLAAYLTLDGMRRVHPSFQQSMLKMYLNKGTDTAAFVQEMEAQFNGRVFGVMDEDVLFAEGAGSFATIFAVVGLAILIIAWFVVILLLYFVVGSAIIRQHRELGIQKAIGYTTVNLMNQISGGFAFSLILGAAAGCCLGAAITNPLMSLGGAEMGLMKAAFIINPIWVAATGAVLVVLSYLTSMFVTWRIRSISAYKLVSQ